jgi:hypothetical protein
MKGHARPQFMPSKPAIIVDGRKLSEQRVLCRRSLRPIAVFGIFMTPLSIFVVAGTLAVAVLFAFVVDAAKGPVFGRLGIT